MSWYPEYSPFNVPYIVGEALDHFSFVVEKPDNTVDQLVEKAVYSTEITPSKTEGWFAYLKGPNGNLIEIYMQLDNKTTIQMKIIQKAGPEVLVLISVLNADSIALIEMVKFKRLSFTKRDLSLASKWDWLLFDSSIIRKL
jgi:hypothetical protein